MIDKIKILCPYVYGFGPEIGTTFDTREKSILITGDIGRGKSSLLHMISESIRINKERVLHDPKYISNPSSELIETPRTRAEFSGVSQVGQEFLFNAKMFQNKISKTLLKYIYCDNITNHRHDGITILPPYLYTEYYLEEKFEELLKTLNSIAKETKTTRENVYGVAYLIALGHTTRIENPITEFFYTKLSGNIKNPQLVLDYNLPKTNKRIQENLGEFSQKNLNKKSSIYNLSTGEVQVKKLDKILAKENQIVILDEPFANLSEKLVCKYTSKLINHSSSSNNRINRNSQYILSSHNSYLNDKLRAENNWIEINLN